MSTRQRPALKRDKLGQWSATLTGQEWEGPFPVRHLAEWKLAGWGLRPNGYDLIFEAVDPEFREVSWEEARDTARELADGGPLTLEPGSTGVIQGASPALMRYRVKSFPVAPCKGRFAETWSIYDVAAGEWLRDVRGMRRAWMSQERACEVAQELAAISPG